MTDMTDAGPAYAGHRILEAMRGAQRYAQEIYRQIRRAHPEAAGPVLDFGAGDGVFAEKFAGDRIAVDCVEPNPALRSGLRQHGRNVFADIADVPAEGYEFVYAINVLEHISDLGGALASLRRTMRPQARLFVFVPAFNLLWTTLDDEVGHVQRFTRISLLRPLAAAGFEVDELRYFDSLGFPAALSARLLEQLGLFNYSSHTVGFYDRYIFPVSRALDPAACRLFGKNLVALARKAG